MTDQKVVFIDGVGASRCNIESCRDGVQWIRIEDRVYWPLSDADAKRLQSACCGNGSFDGPTTPAGITMTDRELLDLAEPFGEFQYGDAQGHKRIAFARAVLAAAMKENSND